MQWPNNGRKSMDDSCEMDMVDWEIVELLQQDGRASVAQLARHLRMSPPSVAERIKSLERAGVIIGYQAEIDVQALGLAVTAFIRVHLQPANYDEFLRSMSAVPEVRECVQIAEPNCVQLKVTVRDIEHLRRIALKLNGFGNTATAIVLSNPLKSKIVDRSLRRPKKEVQHLVKTAKRSKVDR
jgi:Lrp/AsnC family transcriptional regulator, leucine-responsive regulatory protein